MSIIRELTVDECQKWNDFVTSSPQGSIFQSMDWSRMLANTDQQRTELLSLVCEEEKEILGGIILRYQTVSGKNFADLAPFGSNGPVLAQKLFDSEKRHTYKAYAVLSDLLKGVEERLNSIVLENQSEVWDVRPFMFRSWHINTSYSHVWKSTSAEEAWMQICPNVQASIESAQKNFEFRSEFGDNDIERFVDLSGKMHQQYPGQVLKKRIEWMRDHQNCQLHSVSDSTGGILAMALIVLSKENGTAYILNTVFADEKSRTDTEAYLFWQSYLALACKFSWINIGTDDKCNSAHLKDNLGSELVPCFLTSIKTHTKSHSVQKQDNLVIESST